MQISGREIEAAEAHVQREADAAIASIRCALAEDGEDICVECDEPIAASRKAALPSAERCIECQAVHEMREKREARGY